MMRSFLHRPGGDSRGAAMPVALIFATFAAAAVVVITSAVTGQLRQTRSDNLRAAGLNWAEAAISDLELKLNANVVGPHTRTDDPAAFGPSLANHMDKFELWRVPLPTQLPGAGTVCGQVAIDSVESSCWDPAAGADGNGAWRVELPDEVGYGYYRIINPLYTSSCALCTAQNVGLFYKVPTNRTTRGTLQFLIQGWAGGPRDARPRMLGVVFDRTPFTRYGAMTNLRFRLEEGASINHAALDRQDETAPESWGVFGSPQAPLLPAFWSWAWSYDRQPPSPLAPWVHANSSAVSHASAGINDPTFGDGNGGDVVDIEPQDTSISNVRITGRKGTCPSLGGEVTCEITGKDVDFLPFDRMQQSLTSYVKRYGGGGDDPGCRSTPFDANPGLGEVAAAFVCSPGRAWSSVNGPGEYERLLDTGRMWQIELQGDRVRLRPWWVPTLRSIQDHRTDDKRGSESHPGAFDEITHDPGRPTSDGEVFDDLRFFFDQRGGITNMCQHYDKRDCLWLAKPAGDWMTYYPPRGGGVLLLTRNANVTGKMTQPLTIMASRSADLRGRTPSQIFVTQRPSDDFVGSDDRDSPLGLVAQGGVMLPSWASNLPSELPPRFREEFRQEYADNSRLYLKNVAIVAQNDQFGFGPAGISAGNALKTCTAQENVDLDHTYINDRSNRSASVEYSPKLHGDYRNFAKRPSVGQSQSMTLEGTLATNFWPLLYFDDNPTNRGQCWVGFKQRNYNLVTRQSWDPPPGFPNARPWHAAEWRELAPKVGG